MHETCAPKQRLSGQEAKPELGHDAKGLIRVAPSKRQELGAGPYIVDTTARKKGRQGEVAEVDLC